MTEPTLTIQQIQAIKCAYADLVGAIQAYNQGDMHIHDWSSHEASIEELEEAFPTLIEPVEL